MVRNQNWVLIIAVLCLAGCSVDSDESEPAVVAQTGAEISPCSWRELYLELGRETYHAVCASCHDEGLDNAPAIGDRDAWSTRSPLWSAILLKHAKDGYLDMPALGGHPELTEKAVEAAGEYMLSETFPELPRD